MEIRALKRLFSLSCYFCYGSIVTVNMTYLSKIILLKEKF